MKADWNKLDSLLKEKQMSQCQFSRMLHKEDNWYAGQKSRNKDYDEQELVPIAYHLGCRVEDIRLKETTSSAPTKASINIENTLNIGFNTVLDNLSSLKSEMVGIDSRLYAMADAVGTICDYVEENRQPNGLAKRVIIDAFAHNARISDKDMITLKNLLSITEMQFSMIKSELGITSFTTKEGPQNKTEKYWKLETGYRS